MTVTRAAVPAGGSLRMGASDAERPGPLALAGLSHPVTLAAIALLLLNDHAFKRAFPSILTGKLSDVAGMFFFPFLLAALIGLSGRPSRRGSQRALMAVCFAATAFGFTLIKIDPTSNALAVQILERMLGLPVRIVRDPTDLIALLALWPAWRLWRSVDERRVVRSDRSLLAVGLASLAALATAPCLPESPVRNVVVVDGQAYALTSPANGSEGVYRSLDGSSWDLVDPAEVPPEVAAVQVVERPKIVCVTGLEQTCYRVAGEERVEASSDGGVTWQVAWTAPSARRAFMQRVAAGYGQLLACGKDLDFRANDVAILGQGVDHRAIVALGNEGVLVGPSGGAWSRVAVGLAEPTPERGELQNLAPPGLIFGETAAAVLAAAGAMMLFSILAWGRFRVPVSQGGPRRSDTPLRVGVVVSLLVLILMFALNIQTLIPYAVVPLVAFVAWMVFLWTGWLQTLSGERRAPGAGAALGLSVLGSILVGLAVWVPFALWVFGIVPAYPLALLAAVAAGAAVVAIFWRLIAGRAPAAAAA